MRWGGGDVTSMKKKNTFRFFIKNLEERDHLAYLRRKDLEKVWTGFIWLKTTCDGGLL